MKHVSTQILVFPVRVIGKVICPYCGKLVTPLRGGCPECGKRIMQYLDAMVGTIPKESLEGLNELYTDFLLKLRDETSRLITNKLAGAPVGGWTIRDVLENIHRDLVFRSREYVNLNKISISQEDRLLQLSNELSKPFHDFLTDILV